MNWKTLQPNLLCPACDPVKRTTLPHQQGQAVSYNNHDTQLPIISSYYLKGYDADTAREIHTLAAFCLLALHGIETLTTWMRHVRLVNVVKESKSFEFSAPTRSIADHLNYITNVDFNETFDVFSRFVIKTIIDPSKKPPPVTEIIRFSDIPPQPDELFRLKNLIAA